MSCCGQNRQRLGDLDSNQQMLGFFPADKRTPRTPSLSLVYFEYIGRTGLTVTGPITGKRYRFQNPGAKIAVDSNDAPSLAAVPNLRQTRSP
jgi:hypothetical protein